MKYAFIDYENLNTLDGLALNEYERIFLFLGSSPNQADIHLTERFNDALNLTLVTVKAISKNNVDFHITYYLGKLDAAVDKHIEFYVLSQDQGYDGICDFIQSQQNGRICRRKSLSAEPEPVKEKERQQIRLTPQQQKVNEYANQAFAQYREHILGKGKNARPLKLNSLKNDILNRTVINKINTLNKQELLNIAIKKLTNAKLLKVSENEVSYFI